MQNLIKIQTTENLEQIVSARELHDKLGIEKHFTQWWEQQASRLNLEEGRDFLTCKLESQGGRPATDYLIPIDIAKHICMMSGGSKAYEIRGYFICPRFLPSHCDFAVCHIISVREYNGPKPGGSVTVNLP